MSLVFVMLCNETTNKKNKKPVSDSRSVVLCMRFEPDGACYCVCLNATPSSRSLPLRMTVSVVYVLCNFGPIYSVCVRCPHGGAVHFTSQLLGPPKKKILVIYSSS